MSRPQCPHRDLSLACGFALAAILLCAPTIVAAPTLSVRQLTHGPYHHFFGYIGHVGNIPWNASGRYIVALRSSFHDRMPKPGEAADVVLIDTRDSDTQDGNKLRVVDQSRAWNFQQGTMFYWNPEQPETQFFFNDRDPETNRVFCVLFDISKGERGQRLAEFKFADTPFGNSGVAQQGGAFLGINYGRLARLRPVTGYPGAYDWTVNDGRGELAPNDDGVFRVDLATGQKRLIVSFRQLAELLAPQFPKVREKELFINHTLWNRTGDRVFFFVRGDFERGQRLDVPCVMNGDGGGLHVIEHLGGHPEWADGHVMLGSREGRQVLYDIDRGAEVGVVGTPELFPDAGGDKAISRDGRWMVNGYRVKGQNRYTFYRFADGAHVTSRDFDQFGRIKGELRVDAAPCWNRTGTQIVFPSMDESGETLQMFMIELHAPAQGP
jgi:hypothetical protein